MAQVPKDVIDVVRSAITVSDFIKKTNAKSTHPIELRRRGSGYLALCPFHAEKTPSFHVVDGKQIYHCFGCGENGDVFKLAQKLNLAHSFPDSIAYVAGLAGVQQLVRPYLGGLVRAHSSLELELEAAEFNLDVEDRGYLFEVLSRTQRYFVEQLHTNTGADADAARAYLKSRGIPLEFARHIGLGYAPAHDLLLTRLMKESDVPAPEMYALSRRAGLTSGGNRRIFSNRITFPAATRGGQALGFISRRLTESKHSPKYKNSPQGEVFNKSHILFGLEHLCDDDVRAHGLVLVEGTMDLFGFLAQGLGCALALGSTALTDEHTGLLAALRPTCVYLMTDGDAAGIKGAIRNANRLLGTKNVSLPQIYVVPIVNRGEDPFDVFYTANTPALAYIRGHRQTPKDFLLAQNVEDLLTAANDPRDFLRANTFHIANMKELTEKGLQVWEQQSDRYKAVAPHPLLLQN